jgi:hypothetical protein
MRVIEILLLWYVRECYLLVTGSDGRIVVRLSSFAQDWKYLVLSQSSVVSCLCLYNTQMVFKALE